MFRPAAVAGRAAVLLEQVNFYPGRAPVIVKNIPMQDNCIGIFFCCDITAKQAGVD